jgi:uncharacterized protein (DUF305 family)
MKRSFALALISLAALAGSALAQSATEERPAQPATGAAVAPQDAPAQPGATIRTQPGTTTSPQASSGGGLDKQIAVCLTLGNKEEVALAQFAQARAQNAQVKEFAQKLAEHHQQAIAKLEKAAPEVATLNLVLRAAEAAAGASASPLAQSGAAASATRPATSPSAEAGAPASARQRIAAYRGPAGEQLQMFELVREIKQECLNLTQAELGKQQGANFDKCFVGQQLVAHLGMLAELRASQRHVSGELQPVIQEGIQMTEQHLAQARSIMEQLEKESATADREQAQRPGAAIPPRP